jgi:hypothetical protein
VELQWALANYGRRFSLIEAGAASRSVYGVYLIYPDRDPERPLLILAVWKRFGDREGTGILRLRCGRHRFGDFGGLPAPSGCPAWSCRFSPA